MSVEKCSIHLYWVANIIPRFRADFPVLFIAKILSDYKNAIVQNTPHLLETLIHILNMIENIDAYAKINSFVPQG
jgi:hypothetical protein